MITIDEQDEAEGEVALQLQECSVLSFVAVLRDRYRLIGSVTALGLVFGAILACLLPSEYVSTVLLMPPDPQSLSSPSMLNGLSGAGLAAASMGGGLMNQKTVAGTFIGILGSKTVQDNIIDRFDLRKAYHCSLYVDARKTLTKRTTLVEEKKSGIISITVMDHDRYRARDIANAYILELGKLVNGLSSSAAGRERMFLEDRLKSVKADLDSNSQALSQFSSRNATFDPAKQGEATVEAAGKLQGDLIAAQSDLSGLRAMYTDDNVRVRQARGRVDELQKQLNKISGTGVNSKGANHPANHGLPSVRELPVLGVTYYDLFRKVTIQETLYETLTQQYEFAKVQEAKEIPPIKVLDAPDVPERRSFPHRTSVVGLSTLFFALAAIAWVIGWHLWGTTEDAHPAKAAVMDLWRTVRHPKAARNVL